MTEEVDAEELLLMNIWDKSWHLLREEEPGQGVLWAGDRLDGISLALPAGFRSEDDATAVQGELRQLLPPGALARLLDELMERGPPESQEASLSGGAPGDVTEWLFLEQTGFISVAEVPGWGMGTLLAAYAQREVVHAEHPAAQMELSKAINPLPLPRHISSAVAPAYLTRDDLLRWTTGLRESFQAFLSREASLAASLMRRDAESPSLLSYNQAMGLDAEDSRRAARWRQQMVAIWPLLASDLWRSPEVREAVDTGTPLVPVLERVTWFSPHVLKAFRGAPFGYVFDRPEGAMRFPRAYFRAGILASQVPASWVPATPDDWMACLELANFFVEQDALEPLWGWPLKFDERHEAQAIRILAAHFGIPKEYVQSPISNRDIQGEDEKEARTALVAALKAMLPTYDAPRKAAQHLLQDMLRRQGPEWSTPLTSVLLNRRRNQPPPEEHGEAGQRLSQGVEHIRDMTFELTRDILAPMAMLAVEPLRQGEHRQDWHRRLRDAYIHASAAALDLVLVGRSPTATVMASYRHLQWDQFRTQQALAIQAAAVANGFEERGPAGQENPLAAAGAARSGWGALPDGIQSGEWPAMAADAVAPNGLRLQHLVSERELLLEGQALGHCVGSYGWQCRSAVNGILSIRNAEGESLSTVELGVVVIQNEEDPEAWNWKVAALQHRSKHNQPPRPECVEALDWYLESLGQEVALNTRHLTTMAGAARARQPEAEGQEPRRRPNMTLEIQRHGLRAMNNVLGRGWEQDEALQTRWRIWRRVLDIRHRTPQEWLASLPADIWQVTGGHKNLGHLYGLADKPMPPPDFPELDRMREVMEWEPAAPAP